jgi:hypothetical protein
MNNKSELLLATVDRALHPDTPTEIFAAWLRFYTSEYAAESRLRLACDSIQNIDQETSGLISRS